MEISTEIYNWLVAQKIMQPEGRPLIGEKTEITKHAVMQLENGIIFSRIAKYMEKVVSQVQKRPETPLPSLDSLKELLTPAARIYNWNILTDIYKKFNVIIDPDVKSLIISGDKEMIYELLKELFQTIQQVIPQKHAKIKGKSQQEFKDTIDLQRLDPQKDISKSKSCLEFFIVILSKHLELDPKQTTSLFTHGNKYLAHVIAKGVKGLFDPIVSFYQEVYANCNVLLKFFSEDTSRKSLHFSLSAMKPGLVSRNFDVAQWAARLFSKLAFEFGDSSLLVSAWDWFVGEGGGLNTTLLGLKRHPNLKDLIVSILLQFGRYNFVELFSTHLKKSLPDQKDLINCIYLIFPPIIESQLSREEVLHYYLFKNFKLLQLIKLLTTGILDEWIDTALEYAQEDYKNSADLRIISLTFIADVWVKFPQKIEDQELKANTIINLLSKSTHDKSQVLVYSSFAIFFRLLLTFGQEKNPYAPIIYKSLTLSTIENHMNSPIREFALTNFMTIYDQIESIPINILLEPLIKQIQVTDQVTFYFNIFDFSFFFYVSKFERLPVKNAIQLLDLLAKVYLNNVVYSQLAAQTIISIISRKLEDETLQEFVIKFVKIALAMFYASEKKKKPKEKLLPLYNSKTANQGQQLSPQEIESEILHAQKRSQIVSIIKSIVSLNYEPVNEKIKPLVAHTNIQIKNFSKQNNKGMMSILALYGQPDEVLRKYEEEYQAHQTQMKKEERELLEKEQQQLADSAQTYNFESSIMSPQNETIKLIEENLRKYGYQEALLKRNIDIKSKKKASTLSKAELTKLANLRNPKADPRALKDLQDIKKNFNERVEEELKKKEKEVKEQDNLQKNLRYTLSKRSIEQGISVRNQKDYTETLLFELGSREKELKREKKVGLAEVQFFDLDKEEERDKEMITVLLKKYNKALRFIFMKYANTGFSIIEVHSQLKTFDEVKDKLAYMSIAELWKAIKDYQFDELITQEDHKSLVRIVNTEGLHKQAENQNLTYEGFEIYLIQFSAFVYSKPPLDLRHLPLSLSLQKVIDQFRKVMSEKKQSTILFDEPESAYFGEDIVIKDLNQKLEQDPETVLPEGYRKVKEKQISFQYQLSPNFPISESYNIAFDVLQSIFQGEKLQISLLEPISDKKDVILAQPQMNNGAKAQAKFMDMWKTPQSQQLGRQETPKPQNSDSPDLNQFNQYGVFRQHMKDRAHQSADNLFKILPGSTFEPTKKKYGDKRVLQIENFHKLGSTMKLKISSMPYKDRWQAEQCAFVLDDLIYAVENNIPKIPKEGLFHIENQIELDKKKRNQEKEEQEKIREEKYKNGQEFVLKKKEELKTQKDKDEEEKKAEIEKKKQEQLEQQKKKKEDKDSYLASQKEKIQQHQEKQSQVTNDQLNKLKEEDNNKKEEKTKKFKEFISKQIEKQIYENRKQKAEKQKQKEIKQKELKEKLYKTLQEEEPKRKEFEKKTNEAIKEIHDKQFSELYKKHEFKIKKFFQLLIKYTFNKITNNAYDNEISFRTFSWFCFHFNILPEIIHPRDAILIYRSLTRNKVSKEEKIVGLNYQEFKQALTRIAIKGKMKFNKFAEKLDDNKEGENLNQKNKDPDAVEDKNSDIGGGGEEDQIKQKQSPNKVINHIPKPRQVDLKFYKPPDPDFAPIDLDEPNENVEKYQQLVDDYGNISLANEKTLECLFYYLGLPDDAQGIEDRFKEIAEKGYEPDKHRIFMLRKKMRKDPRQLVKEKPSLAKLEANQLKKLDYISAQDNQSQQQQKLNDNDE